MLLPQLSLSLWGLCMPWLTWKAHLGSLSDPSVLCSYMTRGGQSVGPLLARESQRTETLRKSLRLWGSLTQDGGMAPSISCPTPHPSQPTQTSRPATCPSSWTPGRCLWRSSVNTCPMTPASGSSPGSGCILVRPSPSPPHPPAETASLRSAEIPPSQARKSGLAPTWPALPIWACIPRTGARIKFSGPPGSLPAARSRAGPSHLLGEDAGLPVCFSSPSMPAPALPALPVWQRGPRVSSPSWAFLPGRWRGWPLLPVPLHPRPYTAHLDPGPCPHRESPWPWSLR